MGRKRKIKEQVVSVMNELGEIQEVSEVGVPGLFSPQEWDIQEELANNEALRDYHREQQEEF